VVPGIEKVVQLHLVVKGNLWSRIQHECERGGSEGAGQARFIIGYHPDAIFQLKQKEVEPLHRT
jgi:hypothetical protein